MTWLIFLGALFNTFLGFFVFSRNKKKKLNILFSLFCLVSAIVGYIDFAFRFFPTLEVVKWAYAFGAFLPVIALSWTYELENKKLTGLKIILFLSPAIIFFLLAIANLVIQKVHYLTDFGYRGEAGELFTYYTAYASFFTLLVLWRLYVMQKKSLSSLQKMQSRYALLGLVIYGAITSVVSLTLPAFFNNYNFTALDSPSSLFFVGLSTYAILRYRLMDIRVLASRIYVYFLIGTYSYISFYFVALIGREYLGGIYSPRALSFGGLFAFIYAMGFIPLLNKVQESSDVFFFKGYNPRKIFKDLAIQLGSVLDLKEVFKTLNEGFKKILGTEDVGVVLFEKAQNKEDSYNEKDYEIIPVYGKIQKACPAKKKSVLCQSMFQTPRIILRYELKDMKEDKIIAGAMDEKNMKIIAPLIMHSKIIGVIVLGEKMTQEAYTKEDLEFLEVIRSQAAVAIENARLHDEVEEFNKNLQKKVEEQTQDIQEKSERLQKLLAMRSEFLDITSHQLKTPVSVIKGVLSMLEEGSVPKERVDEFLKMAFQKSLKLEEVINEILRASELDSDKFALKLKPTDITKLIKEIHQEKVPLAKRKNLELKLNLPKKTLNKVITDYKYLKHVIVNLLNNSIQYTKKGSILLTVKQQARKTIITISDTGIGIPKKDIAKLFDKFTRAQNAKDAYTDGSGLGLYIIKQIMDAHKGGKARVKKTKLGKGTTFEVIIPTA